MGVIGPHEGKELDLMLKGLKNLALFYTDYDIPYGFIPYLESGFFKRMKIRTRDSNNNKFYYYIIYIQRYKRKAKKLSLLLEKSKNCFNPTYEKKIGKLLGYSKEDIEFYIENYMSNFFN
ncbi:hemocin immunity protein [Gallibacterium anatis]|uniref:hemocin immunity protein n=1 Tax=Gallibacterium anatis TaxID=750 RepID=UPI0026706826|nr:hemocin immunity protein [Gallibacterium anatis]WKS97428.1 hemocin immunity protein [Gallibacterium anatis]